VVSPRPAERAKDPLRLDRVLREVFVGEQSRAAAHHRPEGVMQDRVELDLLLTPLRQAS
jgi:hypothetical protein